MAGPISVSLPADTVGEQDVLVRNPAIAVIAAADLMGIFARFVVHVLLPSRIQPGVPREPPRLAEFGLFEAHVNEVRV